MAVENNIINNYEGIVILNPKASEEEQKTFFKKNKEIVEQFAGKVNHLDTWGSRALANPINKLSRGVYFHTTFTANNKCVSELERTMRINDNVLRFFHAKLDGRTTIEKHLEKYKEALTESKARFDEREAKFQAKKAAMSKKFRKPSR